MFFCAPPNQNRYLNWVLGLNQNPNCVLGHYQNLQLWCIPPKSWRCASEKISFRRKLMPLAFEPELEENTHVQLTKKYSETWKLILSINNNKFMFHSFNKMIWFECQRRNHLFLKAFHGLNSCLRMTTEIQVKIWKNISNLHRN